MDPSTKFCGSIEKKRHSESDSFLFFVSFFFVPRAPVVSGFLCFPVFGALGLGALRFRLPSPRLVPPPLFFCFLLLFCFFSSPPFFVCAMLVSLFLGGGAAAPCLCGALRARPTVLCAVLFLPVVCAPLLLRVLCWWWCCPARPPAVALVASACAWLVCFFLGGGCCPVPVRCPVCSPCGVVCRAVSSGGVCSLTVVRLVLVVVLPPPLPPPPRPSPWWLVLVFVPAAPFVFCFCLFSVLFFAFLFLVLWSSCPWCGPPSGACAAVLCPAGVIVLSCSLVSCVISFLALLFTACSGGFFLLVPVCRAFWCGAALRCSPVCVVRCAGLLLCPAVWCVAGLPSVVLSCCLVLACVGRLSLVLCRAGLGRSRVVVCLPVLSFVVRFVALLLLFVASSPVLARCLWVWRWRALWRFLWCIVLFLLVLCLVARVVRCCGVLCRRACFVSPCVVFRCRLDAGWCLVLMSVFGGHWWVWYPGTVFWWCASALGSLSGRVVHRPVGWRLDLVPCCFLFPGALSCGALLPGGAVLSGFPVLLPLLLVFVFAHYFKSHCKIRKKTNFSFVF